MQFERSRCTCVVISLWLILLLHSLPSPHNIGIVNVAHSALVLDAFSAIQLLMSAGDLVMMMTMLMLLGLWNQKTRRGTAARARVAALYITIFNMDACLVCLCGWWRIVRRQRDGYIIYIIAGVIRQPLIPTEQSLVRPQVRSHAKISYDYRK